MKISLNATAAYVHKKWSTWVALFSASCAAGLLTYDHLSVAAQAAFPNSLLTLMAVTTVLGPLLVPLVTSLTQPNIPDPPVVPPAPTQVQ